MIPYPYFYIVRVMETKTIRYEMLLTPSLAEKLSEMAKESQTSKAAVIESLLKQANPPSSLTSLTP